MTAPHIVSGLRWADRFARRTVQQVALGEVSVSSLRMLAKLGQDPAIALYQPIPAQSVRVGRAARQDGGQQLFHLSFVELNHGGTSFGASTFVLCPQPMMDLKTCVGRSGDVAGGKDQRHANWPRVNAQTATDA